MAKWKNITTADGQEMKVRVKPKWYQRKLVWLLALIVVIGFASSGNDSTENNDNSSAQITESSDNQANNESNEVATQDGVYTLGDTFEWDGSSGLMEITLGDSYSFDTLSNQFSDKNGEKVIVIPVTIKNIGDESGGMNFLEVTYYGASGSKLDRVGTFFDADWEEANMRAGGTQEGFIYMPYDGDGEYAIELGVFKTDTEIVFTVEA